MDRQDLETSTRDPYISQEKTWSCHALLIAHWKSKNKSLVAGVIRRTSRTENSSWVNWLFHVFLPKEFESATEALSTQQKNIIYE